MCRSFCGKAHLLRRLRIRAGFGTISGLVFDPFEFRSEEPRGQLEEWKNLEQLEATVEFFVNFRPDPVPTRPGWDDWGDPWAANAKPLESDHPRYQKVNLGRVEGTAAEVTAAPGGAIVKLDGDPDLADVLVNPQNTAQGSARRPFRTNVAPNPDNSSNPRLGPPLAQGYPELRPYLYDTIQLESDRNPNRASKLYRIMAVDNTAKTVTLDMPPNLGGKTSEWTIHRRPIIVVVDPLGARTITDPNTDPNGLHATAIWSDTDATIVGPDPAQATRTILQLNGAQPLDRINIRQDTIYLPKDGGSHKPARTYRIVAVDAANRRITIDGTPSFAGSSAWNIPAGVSGTLSGGMQALPGQRFQYDLNPPNNPAQRGLRGHDHYDADLFIVQHGQVRSRFRFTSYTSRDWGSWSHAPAGAQWQDLLSSVRGNGRYFYSSFRSGNKFRNYSLAIVDADPAVDGLQHDRNDHIARGRFYFGTADPPATAADGAVGDALSVHVMPDSGAAAPAGKTHVRFHHGLPYGAVVAGNPVPSASNTGSAGCLVSPVYFQVRNELVRYYEEEYRRFYGGGLGAVDPEIHRFIDPTVHPNGLSVEEAGQMWTNGTIAAPQFDGKLVGTIWLVRPDEVPLS